MIYRFIVSDLLTTSGFLLICSSYLSGRITQLVLRLPSASVLQRFSQQFVRGWGLWLVAIALVVFGACLVAPAFVDLVLSGATYEHWSRFIAMSVCVSIALTLLVTRVADFSIELLEKRLAYLRETSAEW